MPSGRSQLPLVFWPSLAIVLTVFLSPVTAHAFPPRFGWQGFSATYAGGYSIGGTVNPAAGPARITVHAAANGRSARVSWRNTFYNAAGSYVIAMNWNFRSDGTVSTTTLDPRDRAHSARGTFTLFRNHPVKFTVTDSTGTVTATGKFRLIGGGTLSVTAILSGLVEGTVPYGFSGSRTH